MSDIEMSIKMDSKYFVTFVVQVAGNLFEQMNIPNDNFQKKAVVLLHLWDEIPPKNLREYFKQSVFSQVCFIYDAVPKLVGFITPWQAHVIWSALWNYKENIHRLGLLTIGDRNWTDRIDEFNQN